MIEECKKTLEQLVSPQALQQIDRAIAKYPTEQRQSAVMSALTIVQEEANHLTAELMDAVANYLRMPAIAVYEVATFYTMYEHEPVGKNVIHVCRSISCYLRGSDDIVNHLESKLGVTCGHTTEDGRYTLKQAECLGACVNAPMMMINKDYHEKLEADKLNAVLEAYQ